MYIKINFIFLKEHLAGNVPASEDHSLYPSPSTAVFLLYNFYCLKLRSMQEGNNLRSMSWDMESEYKSIMNLIFQYRVIKLCQSHLKIAK